MYAFLSLSTDQLRTLQSSADQTADLKVTLIFMLSFAVLVGILNLLFYFFIKKSPDQSLMSLLPNLSLGRKSVTFTIENDLGRPLGHTKCTIFKNEKIYRTIYPFSGHFGVSLKPGKYSATVSKFGYLSAQSKDFEIRDGFLKLELTLKHTEEVVSANALFSFSYVLFGLSALLSLSNLIIFIVNYFFLTLGLQLVLLALLIFSSYLTYRYYLLTQFIKAKNFKNHFFKNQPIEIFGKDRDPLKKITTNKNGQIKILMSPGHYRFSPENYSPRTIRVHEAGLGNFKIKF